MQLHHKLRKICDLVWISSKSKNISVHNHNTINTPKTFNINSMGNVTFSFLYIKNEVGMDVYWT